MPNFEKPLADAQGTYDLFGTESPTPGEVKRLTIPEMTWGNIQLYQGSPGGLKVACDSVNVVPDDGFDPKAPTASPVPANGMVRVGFEAVEVSVTLPLVIAADVGANLTLKVAL